MLNRIFIQNFALIDSLDITLEKGLQVITGETGTGKSIILGALRLLMGERADTKVLNHTEQKSVVEAEFTIAENLRPFFDENDLDYDSQTLVRREILPSGKSRAFVNDVPVTLDVLKQLAANLIDIHSQFETSDLFSEAYQFGIIDGLADNSETLKRYQNEFRQLKQWQTQLEALKQKQAEGLRENDYKQFLLQELEEAQLDATDWEHLQAQLATLENAGAISENLNLILVRMDQEEIGLLDQLNDIRSRLSRTTELSHHFEPLKERFESLFIDFKDLLFELQDEAEKIDLNPETREQLAQASNRLNTLFLKHNVQTVEELVTLRDNLAEEQLGFSDAEQHIADTEAKIENQKKLLTTLSDELSKKRQKHRSDFIQKTETLLASLGLEKAKIEVELSPSPDFTPFGKEHIAILFRANAGFPLKPIHTAISGGERSRVMLAVKKIMAENNQLPTLILDEIDTGVSGKVADEMGKVMKEMAQNLQLIVISHLAQVAAKGDRNYKVVKKEVDGKTQSNILVLSPEEKLQEIAQLLSGAKITEAALKQAEALIESPE
ncbi:DNA repair protein RecN [Bergeyella sp. RCAD1439]|uniref:DNA repair protein RecN n=1 Tax=Bergeyella anatis TaxID=3113737 RepID=UPI002E18B1D6|nr:DNA repair protein RecN [Bergeyella sp. RCAD1439]